MEMAGIADFDDSSSIISNQDERIDEPSLNNNNESSAPKVSQERGKIFVEARVKDDFNGDTDQMYRQILRVLSLDSVQSLSLILWQEMLESDAFRGLFPEDLHSLKAVEHIGRKSSSTYFPISSVVPEIHVYRMCNGLEHLEDDGTLFQAEVIQLPSLRFEGLWDILVFDVDIRANLIRLMTNILKISNALSSSNLRPRTNRLILISGFPGTGKTTVCQALAQKLSIRLNCVYSTTSLIQINAATLLSKFFSESAKHILAIFNAILNHCNSSPDSFTIVLIDEIESLASSRHTASSRGEVQDTIRATNALLTGFDMVRSQPNLIILCTSNMLHTLDVAFLDRCAHCIIVEPPSHAARYQILRDGIQELIAAGIIKDNHCGEDHEQCKAAAVPSYRDAHLTLLSEPTKPGSVLMDICFDLDRSVEKSRLGANGKGRCSARFLGQLPEVALADRMIFDSCSLDEALEHMKNFVLDQFQLEFVADEAPFESGEGELTDLFPSLKASLRTSRKRRRVELEKSPDNYA